ncbi:MAG: type VI secretion system amidase effector protein Tae4 [Acidiferrobacterales bacterium]|nr:type VI secretion system amidase effector protein Tae4 [Acidiferrobacterales bacterium]
MNIISDESFKWKNLCAVRLSYVLNKSGFKVPKQGSKTVSGKNGDWYLYRVHDLIKYLTNVFGLPDVTFVAPSSEKLSTQKGILVFEVDEWGDATGHATIWNGIGCSDSCYFETSKQAHLWTLKD